MIRDYEAEKENTNSVKKDLDEEREKLGELEDNVENKKSQIENLNQSIFFFFPFYSFLSHSAFFFDVEIEELESKPKHVTPRDDPRVAELSALLETEKEKRMRVENDLLERGKEVQKLKEDLEVQKNEMERGRKAFLSERFFVFSLSFFSFFLSLFSLFFSFLSFFFLLNWFLHFIFSREIFQKEKQGFQELLDRMSTQVDLEKKEVIRLKEELEEKESFVLFIFIFLQFVFFDFFLFSLSLFSPEQVTLEMEKLREMKKTTPVHSPNPSFSFSPSSSFSPSPSFSSTPGPQEKKDKMSELSLDEEKERGEKEKGEGETGEGEREEGEREEGEREVGEREEGERGEGERDPNEPLPAKEDLFLERQLFLESEGARLALLAEELTVFFFSKLKEKKREKINKEKKQFLRNREKREREREKKLNNIFLV